MATAWSFWIPDEIFVVAAHNFNTTNASVMTNGSVERKERRKDYNGNS
jgi:hypothetical protein